MWFPHGMRFVIVVICYLLYDIIVTVHTMCWSFRRWITRDDHSDMDTESGALRISRSRQRAAPCFTASSVSLNTTSSSSSRLVTTLYWHYRISNHGSTTLAETNYHWTSVCTKRYRIAKCDANWPPCDSKCHVSHLCVIQKKTEVVWKKNTQYHGGWQWIKNAVIHSSILVSSIWNLLEELIIFQFLTRLLNAQSVKG